DRRATVAGRGDACGIDDSGLVRGLLVIQKKFVSDRETAFTKDRSFRVPAPGRDWRFGGQRLSLLPSSARSLPRRAGCGAWLFVFDKRSGYISGPISGF